MAKLKHFLFFLKKKPDRHNFGVVKLTKYTKKKCRQLRHLSKQKLTGALLFCNKLAFTITPTSNKSQNIDTNVVKICFQAT